MPPYSPSRREPDPGPRGAVAARPPRNGPGTAALALGPVALVSLWTLLGGLVLGPLALVLGLLGRRRAGRGGATNGTVALVGAVTGGLALAASAALVAVGVSFLDSDEFEHFGDCMRNAGSASEERRCEENLRAGVGRE
ncbi:hypothetical protein GCM10010420_04380 [Streptomyces glaucosporus]|uniref:DUF4190 domain-containing protein n=1 Tax=Streptomyces glaucosporus TaxID=284044 RepID=A0ABP5URD1_9ACTN